LGSELSAVNFKRISARRFVSGKQNARSPCFLDPWNIEVDPQAAENVLTAEYQPDKDSAKHYFSNIFQNLLAFLHTL